MNTLLISLPIAGLFWTLFLFIFCFGGVYVAELVKLGWAYKTQSPPEKNTTPPERQEKAPAEKPQEPIYYIVERKKRLPKSGFEDAKPFTFKND